MNLFFSRTHVPHVRLPSENIESFLGIKLTESTPFVSVSKKKGIQAKAAKGQSSEKATEQSSLIFKVISELRSHKPLTSFEVIEKSSHLTISTSSSAESLEHKKIDPPKDAFDTYLLKIQRTPRDKKIQIKSRILIATIQNIMHAIISRENDLSLEALLRKNLANDLEWHLKKYITPLTLTVTSAHASKRKLSLNENFEHEQKDVLNDLDVTTLDFLLRHHCNEFINGKIEKTESNKTKVKKAKSELEKSELGKPEKSKIKDYNLLEKTLMPAVLEACIIKKLSLPDLEVLFADIFRQISYIKVKNDSDQTLNQSSSCISFDHSKLDDLTDVQKIKMDENNFNYTCDNFRSLILAFVSQLSAVNVMTDTAIEILDFFDSLHSQPKVTKTYEGFLELCKLFFEYLEASTHENHSSRTYKRKLYFILLTLTQNTYQLQTLALTQLLGELKLKFTGEDSRLIQYQFKENEFQGVDIELNVFSKAHSVAMDNFELVLINKMRSSSEKISRWSCQLSVEIKMKNTTDANAVKNKVVTPLKNLGFGVHFIMKNSSSG